MTSRANLVAYDPAWPERFAGVATTLADALGALPATIEHVGSTSVPGCAAKDTIDVLVSVPAELDDEAIVPPLVAAGFAYEPTFATFLPERRFLRRRGAPFAVNVHVERPDLPGAVRDSRLVFRDALRGDDRLRDAYVELKEQLAASHDSIDDDAAAKSDFVRDVLAGAAERGDHVGVHIRAEAPESPVVRGLVADYTDHLVATVPDGFDLSTDSPPPPGAFEPPVGTFLVMYDDVRPIGCGAVWTIEPGVAEIRRMFVQPSEHGRGLGRRMLAALELAAAALGCHTARLDSMHALTAAVAMYRSQGYDEIEDYNANPNATIWMQRRLS